MLTWYKKLYVGDTAKKKKDKMIQKVNRRKPQLEVYLITLASNPENLLEIISTNQLMQKTIYRRCPMIVGLAAGYWEALELVQQIVAETYETQGNTDVRGYLEERLKKEK